MSIADIHLAARRISMPYLHRPHANEPAMLISPAIIGVLAAAGGPASIRSAGPAPGVYRCGFAVFTGGLSRPLSTNQGSSDRYSKLTARPVSDACLMASTKRCNSTAVSKLGG